MRTRFNDSLFTNIFLSTYLSNFDLILKIGKFYTQNSKYANLNFRLIESS